MLKQCNPKSTGKRDLNGQAKRQVSFKTPERFFTARPGEKSVPGFGKRQSNWMETMNIQKEFENRIKPCAGDRVYPNVAPAEAEKPYLTYFRLSAVPATLDMDGSVNLFNTVFQVDACAETYDEAVTLAESVRTTVDGWERENRIRQEKDLFEVETGLHHVVLEISVWHP